MTGRLRRRNTFPKFFGKTKLGKKLGKIVIFKIWEFPKKLAKKKGYELIPISCSAWLHRGAGGSRPNWHPQDVGPPPGIPPGAFEPNSFQIGSLAGI